MYLIKSGEKIIYDSRDKDTYPVIKPSYNEGLNEAGTLTFTLLPGHPYYNDMKKMQTFVTAYRDGTEFFYGRVLITDKELDGRMEVTCEGGLTFLLDSELEKADHHETIEAFFRRCVTAHNSQVEQAKQFTIGTINAEKALDTSKQYDFNITSYTNVKTAIETMVTGWFGGYVRIRPDGNGGHCIDYLEDYGRTNTQLVRIGHNIIDKSDHISGENIFTILRPVGRSRPTGHAGENTDVTIESMSQSDITLENVVKNGKLLRLTDKIALYGNITRTEQFNSAETPADLLKKAEDYIRRRGTQLPAVCEVNYVDFYHLNNEIMDVRLGDTFTTIEDFDGQVMTVGEISLDLEDPANDTFRLKNPEEINANRLDYNVESGGNGGGSSNSLSSSTAKKTGQDNLRYKYYHEQDEFVKIAAKQIEIAAEERFSAIANKMYLTVMEKEGLPGEFVLQALSNTDDPNGATLVMNVDGFTIRKKAGYGTDGNTILRDYATTSELKVEKGRISLVVTDDANPQIKPASIVASINNSGSTVAISADKILLDGDTLATKFSALSGSFNDLVSGNLSASKLVASTINVSNLEITNSLVYGAYGDLKGKIISGIGAAAESGGQITIPTTFLDGTAGPPINFNIAATQKYITDVAAAERTGWTNATRTVRINNTKSGPGNSTVTLASGDSVTVYAQGKDNAGAAVYTTYGTVTVNAEVAPVNPTVTQCYVRSFSVSSVSKYGDGYEVVGSVTIRINYSDDTHQDYTYTVRDTA